MENAKVNIKKGKAFKNGLGYFGLVFLTILLFFPMLCRIIFKEKKPAVKEDVVISLTCEKTDESIRSSFLNDVPQNISYRVKGNYEMITNEDEETLNTYPVLKKFIAFSQPAYNEETGISEVKFNVSTTEGSLDYEIIFNNITNQEEYYRTQGFSCSRKTQ